MNSFFYKKSKAWRVIALVQISLFIIYLSLNIENVGDMGVGRVYLAIFLILSSAILLVKLIQDGIVIRAHLFLFLIYITWVVVRVVVDFQDINYLKSVTIATTGGIFLFFIIGAFVRWGMDEIIYSNNIFLLKFLIIIFLFTTALIFQGLQERLMDRIDIFLIEDNNASYQRPGNFMVMLFAVKSLAYLIIAIKTDTKKFFTLLFWLLFYSLGMVLNLVNSQMIGSNAATALTAAIYLITVTTSLLVSNKLIREKYSNGQLRLLSKHVFKKIFKYIAFIFFSILTIIILLIQKTDLDFEKTRIFGFGSGENSSINSRFKILKETGIEQIGYAPIFGNLDVARLTTGSAGDTLHNFIPSIFAELGLVGLIIVILLFLFLIINFINTVKNSPKNNIGFLQSMINLWLFTVFILLFLYANIAVGYGWSVMWFFIGLSTKIFINKTSDKSIGTYEQPPYFPH